MTKLRSDANCAMAGGKEPKFAYRSSRTSSLCMPPRSVLKSCAMHGVAVVKLKRLDVGQCGAEQSEMTRMDVNRLLFSAKSVETGFDHAAQQLAKVPQGQACRLKFAPQLACAVCGRGVTINKLTFLFW